MLLRLGVSGREAVCVAGWGDNRRNAHRTRGRRAQRLSQMAGRDRGGRVIRNRGRVSTVHEGFERWEAMLRLCRVILRGVEVSIGRIAKLARRVNAHAY